MSETGQLFGIGLGPGDPELMTLKAVRCLKAASVVAYFAKAGRRGRARTIVEGFLAEGVVELPLIYPLTTEVPPTHPTYIAGLSSFYALASDRLAEHLGRGLDVALLCEGDPLFYGSFMHLFVRLRDRFRVTIVPGVSGMSGCWTSAAQPMTWGDDILTVLPGTLPYERLVAKLLDSDASVIMKLGGHFAKVKQAIAAVGRHDEAIYVEYGTMATEKVSALSAIVQDQAPYFSMILVPGHGRRPV